MEQPIAAWYEIVAVARTKSDVCHLEAEIDVTVKRLAVLSLAGSRQEETAGRAALDIGVCKGGGEGEPAMVSRPMYSLTRRGTAQA